MGRRKEFPITTFIFSLLILLAFILELFLLHPLDFSISRDSIASKPWNVILSIFFHIPFPAIPHALLNLLGILVFGFHVERRIGHFKCAVLFFACGATGNLVQAFFQDLPVLGSSAIVYGMIGFLLVFPLKVKSSYIALTLTIFAFFWVSLEILSIFFLPNVAHLSHFIGFVIGLVFGSVLKVKK